MDALQLPLPHAVGGNAEGGDGLPTPACAQNPSAAGVPSYSYSFEDDRADRKTSFVDTALDATGGMLASPAPVTAAGALSSSTRQAESQPPVQAASPQPQQATEQGKSMVAPVDPYQYLLVHSNFPSPRAGSRGGVGASGRGEDASTGGGGEFAMAYMNQAAAPAVPAGGTMMELAYPADAAGHLKEGVDSNLVLANHGLNGVENPHTYSSTSSSSGSSSGMVTAAGEPNPYPYPYHLQQPTQPQQQAAAIPHSFPPYVHQPYLGQQQQQQQYPQQQQQQYFQFHPQQQQQQQQQQQMSDASYMPQMDNFFFMESNPNVAAGAGQGHYHEQQQQTFQQQDASTSTMNSSSNRIVMPSSHPYPYQHHHQQLQQQQQAAYSLTDLAPATSPSCYHHHVTAADFSSHPHTSSSCSTSVTSCTTNEHEDGEEDNGCCSGGGGGGGLHVHTAVRGHGAHGEEGGGQYALSAGIEALMGLNASSPSMTSSDEDDEMDMPHRFPPVAFGIPALPTQSQMWDAPVIAPSCSTTTNNSSSSSSGEGMLDPSGVAGARLRRNAAVAAAAALADAGSRSRRSMTLSGTTTRSTATRSSSRNSSQRKRSSPPSGHARSSSSSSSVYKPPLAPTETSCRRGRRKYSLDSTNFVIVPTPEILPGSLFAKRPNRLCRTPACGNRYRTPGYLCETCGGGRCQVKGCGKLHQGKQGLRDLFFCRAHRNVYALLLQKEEEEEEREQQQAEEQRHQ